MSKNDMISPAMHTLIWLGAGVAMLLVVATTAQPHDADPSWAQYTPDEKMWMGEAKNTKRSRARMRSEHGWIWESCCNHGDRVKAQFRLIKKGPDGWRDEWWYFKKGGVVDGEWVRIPDDVVHTEEDIEDDSSMKNKMSPQMRTEGVLFVYNGVVTCFWPPEEGG